MMRMESSSEVNIENHDEELLDGTPETKSLHMEVDNEVYFLRTN